MSVPAPQTPAQAMAYVEDQVRKLREEVVPLAEYDPVIAGLVDPARGLAAGLSALIARTPGDAAMAGHVLISVSGDFARDVQTMRDTAVVSREAANVAAALVNILGLTGLFLIDDAQTAQYTEAGR